MRPKFDYTLDYANLDLRQRPELYRVGRGEQGVLRVEPYKSEILPHWKFKDPATAEKSARKILALFRAYKKAGDFVGMDMARKFLQMGYTRARRYANHRGGRKYDGEGRERARDLDPVKAASAEVFRAAWYRVRDDRVYAKRKQEWVERYG